ncbi:hypothetical protein [Glutamicibacter sp.]|uniref:hypothetical protein n=1 Tax=Glutamicibacter sp. TaxID=1931995 RepID=UPI0028BEB38E|nr:hypothetical protein [Glutamicibacter sp.]
MGKNSRSLVAVVGVGALAVAAVPPASAAAAEKTARSLMEAEQPVIGEMEGFDGNAHFISFMAGNTGKGDLAVVNFDCLEGAPPSWDSDSGCEVLDIVGMYGYNLDVDINKKLTSGTLSGEFQVYLGEAEDGSPIWGKTYNVDVVMKGYGEVERTDDRQEGYRDLRKTRSANVESGTLHDSELGHEFDLTGAEGALLRQRTWSQY